jgi:hypothetical protein
VGEAVSRKDVRTRIITSDGTALELRILDGLLVDDVCIQGAKAEGYRVMTGKDVFPTTGRDIKDYMIRLGFVTE